MADRLNAKSDFRLGLKGSLQEDVVWAVDGV